MNMRYENIKSIILTILVVTSVVITWSLWTYQPNYETMENANYVQEVALSEQKEINNIVKPDTVLYHHKDVHYGTTDSGELDRTIQELKGWSFLDIENISDEVKNISDFVQAEGNVEIIFPDVVPFELYKNAINIEDKNTPEFKFNRIVFNVENRSKEDGLVYFIQYGNPKEQHIYVSHISFADVKGYKNQFYDVSNQLTPYFAFKATDERTLFIPDIQTNLTSFKYFLNRLDAEKFKDALFSDPSFVQKNYVTNNEEYTDGSSMMMVDNDTKMLSYVNPAEETNTVMSSNDLLLKGIDFVNEHGGWTGNYSYAGIDELNQKVNFRLHHDNGYPIFNENGLSEIVQVWGQKEIHKYIRPSFALDVPLRSETTEVTLNSGREVLEFIKTKKGFKAESIEELVIGYRMSKDSNEPQLINLVPSWYYRYDNTWAQITPEELGGIKRGLE